jgi:peptide/nickel transport system substrate-binding protein
MRRVLQIVAMLALALASTALAQEPRHGGVLRVGSNSDPATLNPYVFGNEFDRNAFRPVYDPLVEYDLTTYEVTPRLIESWDVSSDGLTWTLNVRQGVVFHDGRPLTSADIVWSFSQAMQSVATRTAPLLSFIQEVEATGEHTVALRLSQPDQLLAHTMVDIRVTPEGHTDFNENPIGTGPFRFVSWEPNRQLTYERNADYWDGDLPYLDGLEIRTIPDASV